ncbi:MAG: hypothetical protein DRO18_00660 [Thermoprotei archaeon]|nr:MAG: hypothetical protein DRO18_00660 [Thermoprotei archaeon]HDN76034.1 DUF1850 domain-containing protein [Acidilobales archaeon]
MLLRNEGLTIKYTCLHSSERTPWVELWVVNSSGIYLKTICWSGSGAGHPSNIMDLDNANLVINETFICGVDIYRSIGKEIIADLRTSLNGKLRFSTGLVLTRSNTNSYIILRVKKVSILQILINYTHPLFNVTH